MKEENLLERITKSLIDIDNDSTLDACKAAVSAQVSPARVIGALSEGLTQIGEKFEKREYFLSELMMAGVIMKRAQEIIKPYLSVDQVVVKGKVVIGTVEGDLHDIGKNIAIALLQAAGFEVKDLEVNVPVEKFIEAVREIKPEVLGMSALLRATVPEMQKVIKAFEHAGLRRQVKVIVGGLPLNEDYARRLGADFYAKDAWKGVQLIKQVVEAE